MKHILSTILALLVLTTAAQAFEIRSNDVKPGGTLTDTFVFNGFGCSGKNISPELHWKGVPKEAKSLAITVYDPDAPTGSGWWHWIVLNLPPTTTNLPQGWKSADAPGAVEMATDFGQPGYGGPCPPPGKPHHYIFTIYALKTEKLEPGAGATHAVGRFMINGATIKKASFTALYGR